jgi:hypothetical protein
MRNEPLESTKEFSATHWLKRWSSGMIDAVITRQRRGNNFARKEHTLNTKEALGSGVFCAVSAKVI